jgi:transposase
MTTTKDTTKVDAVVVFKQDGLGRVRMPAARREQLLDEFERSGLSGKKFAELAGIKYQTFATWAQKRRRQREAEVTAKVPPTATEKVNWLEAVVEQARDTVVKAGDSVLVLKLPGGSWVEISDVKQVSLAVALVRALQPPC